MTYLFSPHWLTLSYESSVEFVAFSFLKSLVVHLILWSLTGVVGTTPLFSAVVLPWSWEATAQSMLVVVVFLWCVYASVGFVLCFMVSLPFSFCSWVPLFCCLPLDLCWGKLTAVPNVMVDTVVYLLGIVFCF